LVYPFVEASEPGHITQIGVFRHRAHQGATRQRWPRRPRPARPRGGDPRPGPDRNDSPAAGHQVDPLRGTQRRLGTRGCLTSSPASGS